MVWVPGFHLKLREVDLRRMDFSEYNLTGGDFSGSSFIQSKFHHANFHSDVMGAPSIFGGCSFRSAKFSGADLAYGHFENCDFSHAELNGVRLTRTKLSGSKLFKTLVAAHFDETDIGDCDFSKAYIFGCSFHNTNLGSASNLIEAYYYSHCHVDVGTLLTSGSLPNDAYRGLGIPEELYRAVKYITKDGKKKMSCFISYASQDEAFARGLRADLEAAKVETWYAPKDIPIGARIRTELDRAVQSSDLVVLILSKGSVESHWVEQEVETAFELERKTRSIRLLPIRVDDAVMQSVSGWASHLRRTRNIGDFSNAVERNENYQIALNRLLEAVRNAATNEDPTA